MKAIYKRELNSYFNTLLGYVFCAFVLLFGGIYCCVLNLRQSYSHFEYVLNYMAFIFIIAVPILTMRAFAEEYRQGSIRLLCSLPLPMKDIVLGKFFAICTVVVFPVIVLGLYPLLLSRFGNISFSLTAGTLLAFYLLSITLASVGLFISSLTDSQMSAAAVTFVTILLMYYGSSLSNFASSSVQVSLLLSFISAGIAAYFTWFLCRSKIASVIAGAAILAAALMCWLLSPETFSGIFTVVLKNLGVFEAFYVFVDGVFDLRNIVYFLSITGLMLFLTVRVMDVRRAV